MSRLRVSRRRGDRPANAGSHRQAHRAAFNNDRDIALNERANLSKAERNALAELVSVLVATWFEE